MPWRGIEPRHAGWETLA